MAFFSFRNNVIQEGRFLQIGVRAVPFKISQGAFARRRQPSTYCLFLPFFFDAVLLEGWG
jgi:hypothetical protein